MRDLDNANESFVDGTNMTEDNIMRQMESNRVMEMGEKQSSECDRAMEMAAQMVDRPLRDAELQKCVRHMAKCPSCAMTFCELFDIEEDAMLAMSSEKLMELAAN